MEVKRISLEAFIKLRERLPVLDVRSPGEYAHAHIPGAHSLPLFTDEERAIVGTAYKQRGREAAIMHGLDFFKMRQMVETTGKLLKGQGQDKVGDKPEILVHCWRGGMRSGAVSWLLNLYGYKVYTLEGGYKAYRNWVLEQFTKDYNLAVLGGYTGSGKTKILEMMASRGSQVIDLEKLAEHKGSAFGGIGQPPQPKQEMFENLLAEQLFKLNKNSIAWIEDESQRIGVLNIPHTLWHVIRQKPVYFLDIPFEGRLEALAESYGALDREKLVGSIMRIQKRLGPLETKTAIGYLLEENIKECFRVLLTYYDKHYRKGLESRKADRVPVHMISCPDTDYNLCTQKLLSCISEPA